MKKTARGADLTAIQGALYALVIFGSLWTVTRIANQPFDPPYQVAGMVMALAGFVALSRYDLLTPWNPGRAGSIGSRLCWTWVTMVGALLLLGYLTQHSEHFSRKVLLSWFIVTPLVLLVMHKLVMTVARRFLSGILNARTAVLVFVNDSARSLSHNLQHSSAFEVVGFFEDREMDRIGGPLAGLSYLGKSRNVAQFVRDHAIEVVFIVLPDDGARRAFHLFEELGDSDATVYYVPDFLLVNLFEAQLREIEGVTVLEVVESPFYGADGLFKRLFDIGFALCVLALSAPLWVLAAVLIKLSSSGRVISRQRRYGFDGERFHLYGFRTTYDGDDAADTAARPDRSPDTRLTPIGRLLQRTAIEALPQFWNVLRGDLSVVGPRPHLVAHNEYYRNAVRRYLLRHKIRPGITGWAQVHGLRGETTQVDRMEERLRYDLEYIRNWSPWLDLKILAMALLAMFRRPRES